MGSILRRVAVRPVPTTAVITTDRSGRQAAKWVPRESKRSTTAPVKTLADGRQVIEVETGCFYAKYRDADGIVHTVSTKCRDEGNAKQFLSELERRAERIRAGVLTRREVAAADRMHEPIGRHIADYIERLPGRKGGQATAMHAKATRSCLERLAAGCGWSCLADLSRADLESWLARETAAGRSARSHNAHRTAAVSFANLVRRLAHRPPAVQPVRDRPNRHQESR